MLGEPWDKVRMSQESHRLCLCGLGLRVIDRTHVSLFLKFFDIERGIEWVSVRNCGDVNQFVQKLVTNKEEMSQNVKGHINLHSSRSGFPPCVFCPGEVNTPTYSSFALCDASLLDCACFQKLFKKLMKLRSGVIKDPTPDMSTTTAIKRITTRLHRLYAEVRQWWQRCCSRRPSTASAGA